MRGYTRDITIIVCKLGFPDILKLFWRSNFILSEFCLSLGALPDVTLVFGFPKKFWSSKLKKNQLSFVLGIQKRVVWLKKFRFLEIFKMFGKPK